MSAVAERRMQKLGSNLPTAEESLGAFKPEVESKLTELTEQAFVRRLWDRDPTLWTEEEEAFPSVAGAMGWLDVVDQMLETSEHLIELQDDLAESGATHVMVLGMGGSSLAPDVFARTFGSQSESPELVVLDSTVPSQVKAKEKSVDLDSTLFVVASKSGTTTEPLAFNAYFWDRSEQDGARFVAITDPDTALDEMSNDRLFFAVYAGDPEIGGRYSALSPFGMVPAAAMGLDPIELLARARLMVG